MRFARKAKHRFPSFQRSGLLGCYVLLIATAFALAVSVWGTSPSSSPWSWPDSFVLVPGDAPLQQVVSSGTDASDIFLKRSGEGWAMWDRQDSNISTAFGLNLECRWTTFRATTGQEAPMCVHSEKDIVSGNIIRKGRWGDCDSLTTMWNDTTSPTRTDRSIYVEIGANIGACVMQMLLTTSAPIVAFEPNPLNQFCLMSTLMRMDPSYRNRVSLFPLALGNSRGSSQIHTAVGNYGNSVVEREIKDMPSQTFKKALPIQVERLDSVLNSNAQLDVALMKMDAQGYECYIMEGMGNALPHHIQLIKAEVAKKWLSDFENCSSEIFTDQLRAVGFDLFRGGNLLRGPVRPRSPIIDIVAKQKREEPSA